MAGSSKPFEHPYGDHSPTKIGLFSLDWPVRTGVAPNIGPTPQWQSRVEKVTAELTRLHHEHRAFQLAERQSTQIGQLLAGAKVTDEP